VPNYLSGVPRDRPFGDAYRAHVSDAVFEVVRARSAAAEDAADCGCEFWFPWDTAGLIEASEVPIA
jgi:hypothetical protein